MMFARLVHTEISRDVVGSLRKLAPFKDAVRREKE
jgi:hypothetical protein